MKESEWHLNQRIKAEICKHTCDKYLNVSG